MTGQHRRTSSGSRERSVGAWSRGSPYPSPSTSPLHILDPLPNVGVGGRHHLVEDGMGMGMVVGVGMSGVDMGGGVDMPCGNGQNTRGGTPIQVAKPNVTTAATADASLRRRINDAKFVCPVPGCGSTFTRHFNLKGTFPLSLLVIVSSLT